MLRSIILLSVLVTAAAGAPVDCLSDIGDPTAAIRYATLTTQEGSFSWVSTATFSLFPGGGPASPTSSETIHSDRGFKLFDFGPGGMALKNAVITTSSPTPVVSWVRLLTADRGLVAEYLVPPSTFPGGHTFEVGAGFRGSPTSAVRHVVLVHDVANSIDVDVAINRRDGSSVLASASAHTLTGSSYASASAAIDGNPSTTSPIGPSGVLIVSLGNSEPVGTVTVTGSQVGDSLVLLDQYYRVVSRFLFKGGGPSETIDVTAAAAGCSSPLIRYLNLVPSLTGNEYRVGEITALNTVGGSVLSGVSPAIFVKPLNANQLSKYTDGVANNGKVHQHNMGHLMLFTLPTATQLASLELADANAELRLCRVDFVDATGRVRQTSFSSGSTGTSTTTVPVGYTEFLPTMTQRPTTTLSMSVAQPAPPIATPSRPVTPTPAPTPSRSLSSSPPNPTATSTPTVHPPPATVAPTPAPSTPAPATPVPATPALDTPTPATPAPDVPTTSASSVSETAGRSSASARKASSSSLGPSSIHTASGPSSGSTPAPSSSRASNASPPSGTSSSSGIAPSETSLGLVFRLPNASVAARVVAALPNVTGPATADVTAAFPRDSVAVDVAALTQLGRSVRCVVNITGPPTEAVVAACHAGAFSATLRTVATAASVDAALVSVSVELFTFARPAEEAAEAAYCGVVCLSFVAVAGAVILFAVVTMLVLMWRSVFTPVDSASTRSHQSTQGERPRLLRPVAPPLSQLPLEFAKEEEVPSADEVCSSIFSNSAIGSPRHHGPTPRLAPRHPLRIDTASSAPDDSTVVVSTFHAGGPRAATHHGGNPANVPPIGPRLPAPGMGARAMVAPVAMHNVGGAAFSDGELRAMMMELPRAPGREVSAAAQHGHPLIYGGVQPLTRAALASQALFTESSEWASAVSLNIPDPGMELHGVAVLISSPPMATSV